MGTITDIIIITTSTTTGESITIARDMDPAMNQTRVCQITSLRLLVRKVYCNPQLGNEVVVTIFICHSLYKPSLPIVREESVRQYFNFVNLGNYNYLFNQNIGMNAFNFNFWSNFQIPYVTNWHYSSNHKCILLF